MNRSLSWWCWWCWASHFPKWGLERKSFEVFQPNRPKITNYHPIQNSRANPLFEPNPLQSDPHKLATCTTLTENLYLIEGRTTTNHINHEPPGFSVFFFQVAWYVEPHLKSCSTNVFVSSLWYLLRACFWRSCGLSSHEVDPLRGSSLDSPYPIDRYPPGDDHISPTQDPASTFWRCFSFSEDGRWMEMDSFLAGIDRTHPQPKRNMTKILYNPIRPVPGMMAFHFFSI